MPSLVGHALRYLSMGYSVIPVVPPKQDSEGKDRKQPRMPWTEYQRRRATHDEVKGWFSRWPDSRIGLVTGAISGIMVVDADNADIHQKLETELLPDNLITPKATSPHGWHYYFQHHPKIRNGTEVAGLKGLDTRGEGGFIMAPPNPALNGAGYAWVLGMEPWTIPVAPLPDKLLKLLLSSSAAYSSAASTRARTLVWKKGGRDDTLFRVANCLIKGGMSPDHVAEVVEQLALKVCDPPFDPVEAARRRQRVLNDDVEIRAGWAVIKDNGVGEPEPGGEPGEIDPIKDGEEEGPSIYDNPGAWLLDRLQK